MLFRGWLGVVSEFSRFPNALISLYLGETHEAAEIYGRISTCLTRCCLARVVAWQKHTEEYELGVRWWIVKPERWSS